MVKPTSPIGVDSVKFRSRRYSPDERRLAHFAIILPAVLLRDFLFFGGILMDNKNIRAVAISGILGAVAFVLMLLDFPLAFIIPSFIKMDFSELPALIAAFTFGPLYGVLVCLIKNLLHLFVTTSAGVGELSNFILGALFVGIAGVIYQYKRTRKGALIATLSGSLFMAVISVPTNYWLVYPAYTVVYGLPLNAIIGMYKALLPSADTLIKALIIFNLPFNFAKGVIVSAICFAIYKKLSPILKYGRKSDNGEK